ncbi:alpha-amylase 2B-like isoform X2 [Dermacentor albipictus]|uniref:alpha-amylase 2B-like isoform X2 n=1 Tax=Dermacentor albipictus TaxID=60249 RepID=UPI0038FBE76C
MPQAELHAEGLQSATRAENGERHRSFRQRVLRTRGRPARSKVAQPVCNNDHNGNSTEVTLRFLLTDRNVALSSAHGSNKEPNMVPGRSVIVHLFEWRFDDIAEECESFLGPRGYGGVQTSPVNEHGIVFGETVKRPWYERYQPVSYKIGNRSGNETQFRDMVRRCNGAGVRVYVDIVVNHMTGRRQIKKGTAGSAFSYDEFSYPAVPYGSDDFHRKEDCGSESGAIENYRDVQQLLRYLRNFGEDWGFLPSEDALTFVDNHDNQRGHGGRGADILTFFEPRLYKMANVFLLAWPYGLPRVMSSYRWPRDLRDGEDRNAWFGPPSDAAWNIEPVIRHSDDTCGGGWICEHRWTQIYNLVELHNVAGFSPVTNWWDNGYHAIAFGRGKATFVVINNEDFRLDAVLQTSLPPGTYCDVISGVKTSVACTGRSFVVEPDGRVAVTVDNLWEDPVIALHIETTQDP